MADKDDPQIERTLPPLRYPGMAGLRAPTNVPAAYEYCECGGGPRREKLVRFGPGKDITVTCRCGEDNRITALTRRPMGAGTNSQPWGNPADKKLCRNPDCRRRAQPHALRVRGGPDDFTVQCQNPKCRKVTAFRRLANEGGEALK